MGKRSRRVGIFAGGHSGRLHSKGGTAAKSSPFEEVMQGWPLKACSAFSIASGSRSQMPSFFPIFPLPAFLDPLTFLRASHEVLPYSFYHCSIMIPM